MKYYGNVDGSKREAEWLKPPLDDCGNKKIKWSRLKSRGFFVSSMALILLVQVQPRVFITKCSEPQVGISNGMDEGSGVAKFLSLRTGT